MNKTLKTIIVLLGIIAISYLFYLLIQSNKEAYFNSIQFKNENYINNRTDMKFTDTILRVGLDKLGLKDVVVLVQPLTESAKQSLGPDTQLKAHVRQEQNGYIVWMDNISRTEALTVLSHEILHIKQYESGRLVVNGTNVIFDGKQYDINEIPYEQRNWEIEAFHDQTEMETYIRDILYIKK